MNLSDLRTLLDYHYWARDRVLEAADALTPEQFTRDLGSSFRSVRDTLAHLYGAEHAWYQRWHGTSPTALAAADQFPDVASIRSAWGAHELKMRAFVEALGEDGITHSFDYKTLDGRAGSSLFSQNIQHLVNHGSYHRGQVTTLLRQLGATPPKSMDMIAFYRLRSPKSPV
jgi:uncharacterized damage-inducible protein DinB